MAIFTNVYGDGHTPDYEGCVLDWYEHNGYDDSDWYAICWNEEKQTIDKVLFDTTRCACSGRAEIDATPEVLRKVYHYWKTLGKSLFDGRTNLAIQVAQEVKRFFPGKVYATVIPRNVRLSEAPSHGKPITAYDRTSRGAEAYQALAVEFLKKQ